MKIFAWSVGIGVSLAFVAPAFGIENPAWTDSVSEGSVPLRDVKPLARMP
jgi:hypothetical protein